MWVLRTALGTRCWAPSLTTASTTPTSLAMPGACDTCVPSHFAMSLLVSQAVPLVAGCSRSSRAAGQPGSSTGGQGVSVGTKAGWLLHSKRDGQGRQGRQGSPLGHANGRRADGMGDGFDSDKHSHAAVSTRGHCCLSTHGLVRTRLLFIDASRPEWVSHGRGTGMGSGI